MLNACAIFFCMWVKLRVRIIFPIFCNISILFGLISVEQADGEMYGVSQQYINKTQYHYGC